MTFDFEAAAWQVFGPVLTLIQRFVYTIVLSVLSGIALFIILFFVRYKLNPFWTTCFHLEKLNIRWKPYDLFRWLYWDFLTRRDRAHEFTPYGFTIFVGRQGSGKTISMIQYLNEMRKKYPNCLIITNFAYSYATKRMTDWRDLLEIRNGLDGVIFAIDEIHSEYNSSNWNDFPESLLSEISQQRKQRVKIVATAQVFSRVAKPIREQAFSVVCCRTYFGRLTRNVEYDAAEYVTVETPYQVKSKCKPLLKKTFVQSNKLRYCYDTYEKIERMKHIEFLPRASRR